MVQELPLVAAVATAKPVIHVARATLMGSVAGSTSNTALVLGDVFCGLAVAIGLGNVCDQMVCASV